MTWRGENTGTRWCPPSPRRPAPPFPLRALLKWNVQNGVWCASPDKPGQSRRFSWLRSCIHCIHLLYSCIHWINWLHSCIFIAFNDSIHAFWTPFWIISPFLPQSRFHQNTTPASLDLKEQGVGVCDEIVCTGLDEEPVSQFRFEDDFVEENVLTTLAEAGANIFEMFFSSAHHFFGDFLSSGKGGQTSSFRKKSNNADSVWSRQLRWGLVEA